MEPPLLTIMLQHTQLPQCSITQSNTVGIEASYEGALLLSLCLLFSVVALILGHLAFRIQSGHSLILICRLCYTDHSLITKIHTLCYHNTDTYHCLITQKCRKCYHNTDTDHSLIPQICRLCYNNTDICRFLLQIKVPSTKC